MEDARFIADISGADAYGRSIVSHAIFDEMLATIAAAREFVVADFFLFNERAARGGPTSPARAYARELTEVLLASKRALPALQVLLITDPINDVHGAAPAPHLDSLRAAGVAVVVTDLDRLRDSNPIYSSFWRLALAWWSAWLDPRWLPHPFEPDAAPVGVHAWARLANAKASRRNLLLADDGHGGMTGIVGCVEPHGSSSPNSGIALKLRGAVLEPFLASELAVARFSGWNGSIVRSGSATVAMRGPGPRIRDSRSGVEGVASGRVLAARALTEGAIRDAILWRLGATAKGDAVEVAMFQLADREILEALLAASARGVSVRVLLDPHREPGERAESGLPNRPAAGELVTRSDGAVKVRWYRTHGERFRSRLLVIRSAGEVWLTAGSADLTRRSLDDYNLGANVAIEAAGDSSLATQVLEYFETLWNNRAPLGVEYTADFELYADPSQLRYWQYRFMEWTGLGPF